MPTLSHEERIGLRRLVDAGRRERLLSSRAGRQTRGLLHGSAVEWPPRSVRHVRETKLPTLEDYERALS